MRQGFAITCAFPASRAGSPSSAMVEIAPSALVLVLVRYRADWEPAAPSERRVLGVS